MPPLQKRPAITDRLRRQNALLKFEKQQVKNIDDSLSLSALARPGRTETWQWLLEHFRLHGQRTCSPTPPLRLRRTECLMSASVPSQRRTIAHPSALARSPFPHPLSTMTYDALMLQVTIFLKLGRNALRRNWKHLLLRFNVGIRGSFQFPRFSQ
jgi:hypothetical protein